jgi:streptogramin lyase
VPHGIWLREATSVAVDSQDRVYVFNRGNMPIVVLDPDRNVIDMWGNDNPFGGVVESIDPYGNKYCACGGQRFKRQHAITIDRDDNLWLSTTSETRSTRRTARARC